MRKISNSLILVLLLLWTALGTWMHYRTCCGAGALADADNNKTVVTEPVKTVAETPAVKTGVQLGDWSYKDGSLRVNSPDHIRFMRDGYNWIDDKDANLLAHLENTGAYLKGKPDRKIDITGYYKADEKNTSIHPNLGLARANDIKAWLINHGAAANQLTTTGTLLSADWFSADTLQKGIDFNFGKVAVKKADAVDERLLDIKSRLIGKPLILHFQTNSDNLALSAKQRQDFSDVIYYLDNVPASKLNVSGHTDNTGDHDYNVNLSKGRADFVKKYLSRNGIGAVRMNTNGYGPDRPVATNTTAEGRAENRRVEVTLK